MEECAAHLLEWQKDFHGDCTTYEYHFWRPQFRDPGLVVFSRRMYEDVLALRYVNSNGMLQDGSNKSYFPHGFHDHICAEAQVNRDCDYEAEYADYMSHLYGEDWEQVHAYLSGISEAFGEKYMAGEDSADPKMGTHYNPSRVPYLEKVKDLARTARQLAATHKVMPTRPQTLAYRHLNHHAEYCELLADVFLAKCQGDTPKAVELMQKLAVEFGRHDYELERYFDFCLAVRTLEVLAKQMPTIEF